MQNKAKQFGRTLASGVFWRGGDRRHGLSLMGWLPGKEHGGGNATGHEAKGTKGVEKAHPNQSPSTSGYLEKVG